MTMLVRRARIGVILFQVGCPTPTFSDMVEGHKQDAHVAFSECGRVPIICAGDVPSPPSDYSGPSLPAMLECITASLVTCSPSEGSYWGYLTEPPTNETDIRELGEVHFLVEGAEGSCSATVFVAEWGKESEGIEYRCDTLDVQSGCDTLNRASCREVRRFPISPEGPQGEG